MCPGMNSTTDSAAQRGEFSVDEQPNHLLDAYVKSDLLNVLRSTRQSPILSPPASRLPPKPLLNLLQPELAHLGAALLEQVDAEPFDVVDADLMNVKFVPKPAGFKINFQYIIDPQHVWVVDFSFYPCTFSLHG